MTWIEINATLAVQDIVICSIFILFWVLYAVRRYFKSAKCQPLKDSFKATIVLTGCATGIGKALARRLAMTPCTIIALDNDQKQMEKNLKIINQIKHKQCKFQYFYLDLSNRNSIKKAAKEVIFNTKKINYLINNAAIMGLPQRQFNQDGIQLQMAVNYIGHCQLIFQLLEHLKKTINFRIINIGSVSHKFSLNTLEKVNINFKDFFYRKDIYDPFLAYSKSKLCMAGFTAMMSYQLQIRNFKGKIVYLHPGFARSSIGRYQLKGFKKLLFWIIYPIYYLCISRSCDQSADNIIYLIAQKYDKIQNGAYYYNNQVQQYSDVAQKRQFQKELWNITLATIRLNQNWQID